MKYEKTDFQRLFNKLYAKYKSECIKIKDGYYHKNNMNWKEWLKENYIKET